MASELQPTDKISDHKSKRKSSPKAKSTRGDKANNGNGLPKGRTIASYMAQIRKGVKQFGSDRKFALAIGGSRTNIYNALKGATGIGRELRGQLDKSLNLLEKGDQ